MLKTGKPAEDYVDKATKHYSSLFKLPSHERILLGLLVVSIIAGFTATRTLIGLTYFPIIVLLNAALKANVFKKEPLINLKRLSALSLFSLAIWTVFAALGAGLQLLLNSNSIWIKLLFIALSASTAMRFLIFYVLSFKSKPTILSASIAEPLA
ncbi:MAG TPA: DUF2070 family protein, partial [Candidatus Bathyarchaeota archaeon]|nr:DUF2070 family protein [Candidatus Bathyarchaeota archaeon]